MPRHSVQRLRSLFARVIARSVNDEAIQGGLHRALDCFACARNDKLRRSRDASASESFSRTERFVPQTDGRQFSISLIRREAERREAHHPDRALCESTAACSAEHASPFGAPPRHSPAARRLNWLSSSSRVSSKTAATGVALCSHLQVHRAPRRPVVVPVER